MGKIYLYGVISAKDVALLPEGLRGLEEAPLYTISSNALGAVVSNISKDKIRPQREYLIAHYRVVHSMSQATTFLPASICNMAPSCQKIESMLRLNALRFQEELQRLKGKIEMGLKVFWEVKNIYQHLTSVHKELAVCRDRIYGNPGVPSPQEKIALGEMFEDLLNKERERYVTMVMDKLVPQCHEVVEAKDPYGEKMVADLACLVDKDLKGFEQGLKEVGNVLDENFLLAPSGPFAPYNFLRIPVNLY